MSEKLTTFNPGWVKNKHKEIFDAGFQRVLLFYLFSTPCDGVSSSGIDLKNYGWGKNVWKNPLLKETLRTVAKLHNGKNYIKCKKLEDMTSCFTKADLDDGFHAKKAEERIAFYHDGKRNEFITILYYIRCALAHGRFEIYKTENGNIYVMEAIKHTRGGYSSRARMVLKESTLIEWIEIFEGSSSKLEALSHQLESKIRNAILHLISTTKVKNKHELANQIDYEDYQVFAQINKMRKRNMIIYDNQSKVWKILDAVDKAS